MWIINSVINISEASSIVFGVLCGKAHLNLSVLLNPIEMNSWATAALMTMLSVDTNV